MKEEIRIRSCKIVDSLSWIPKSTRRISSVFYTNLISNGIPAVITSFILISFIYLKLLPLPKTEFKDYHQTLQVNILEGCCCVQYTIFLAATPFEIASDGWKVFKNLNTGVHALYSAEC